MSTVINKGAPALGGALGYFIVTLYAVPEGLLAAEFVAEGVVMSGIICTNVIMELKVFFAWVGSLISSLVKKKEE